MFYADSLEWKLANALVKRRAEYDHDCDIGREITEGLMRLCLTAMLFETQEFLFKYAEGDFARRALISGNPYLHKKFVEGIMMSGNIRQISYLTANTTVVMRDSGAPVGKIIASTLAPPPQKEATPSTPSTASKIADWVINLRNEANVAEEILESAVAVSQEQSVETL